MNFYKTTFTIMIVVLIICLAIIGTTIAYSNDNVKYPPITSECPDYYKKVDTNCVSQVTDINRRIVILIMEILLVARMLILVAIVFQIETMEEWDQ